MQMGGKDKARGKRRSRSHGMLRLLFRLSRKHLYFGIPTAMFLPDREDYTTTLPKVEYALRLMADYDPLRLARIQRHVASILIFTLPGDLAQWVDSLRMCVIDRHYARSASPEEIATLLVHEATHARLARLGFAYSEPVRERIERLCFLAEISFARRLPDGQSLIATAESQLIRPPTDWTDTAMRERGFEWLDRTGFPSWLTRWIRKRVEQRLIRNHSETRPNPAMQPTAGRGTASLSDD